MRNELDTEKVELRGVTAYRVARGLVKLLGWPEDSYIAKIRYNIMGIPSSHSAVNDENFIILHPDTLSSAGGELKILAGRASLPDPDIIVTRVIDFKKRDLQPSNEYLVSFRSEVNPYIKLDLNSKLRVIVPDRSLAGRLRAGVEWVKDQINAPRTIYVQFP